MKKQLLLPALLMIICSGILAQTVDTSYFTPQILEGSIVFRGSSKNIHAIFNGFYLTDIKKAPCKGMMDEDPGPEKINSVSFKNDSTLLIEMQTTADCSYDFLCEIEIVDDSVLCLIYQGYGSVASCVCCFGLTYEIKLIDPEYYDHHKVKKVILKDYPEVEAVLKWGKK